MAFVKSSKRMVLGQFFTFTLETGRLGSPGERWTSYTFTAWSDNRPIAWHTSSTRTAALAGCEKALIRALVAAKALGEFLVEVGKTKTAAKRTYLVVLTRTVQAQVEVEATSPEEAHDLAFGETDAGSWIPEDDTFIEVYDEDVAGDALFTTEDKS